MDDLTFENEISRLARATAYPPTPGLRSRVLASLDAPAASAEPRRGLAFAWAGAAAAVFIAAVALVAIPGSRTALADLFRVSGSEVEFIATPHDASTATPFPAAADIAADAEQVTLAEARAAVAFAVITAPDAGEPQATFLLDYDGQAVVVLRYAEFDLWQTELRTEAYFDKGVPVQGTIEDVFVGASPARWITDAPHIVQLFDGVNAVAGSERTVERSTLIWNHGALILRMETDLPRDRAIALAAAVR